MNDNNLLKDYFSNVRLNSRISANTKPENIDKYKYIIKNAWKVRTIYLLGIICWLFVVYGFVVFFNLKLIYWLTIAPIVGIFTVHYLVSYGINLFYKSFDLDKHNAFIKKYWDKKKKLPSVDIFVPICGESTEILKKTFHAISKINYKNKKVYVLDDKGDKEHKALAISKGFSYLSRENKGYMKKSGNLKFGFENSNGEFIVIFDADFAPNPDFIKELLPYMKDATVSIVQSPQYFQTDNDIHQRSALEYGAGSVQEEFYRIIQVSRDNFGGAVCVGSNAIYRRKALDSIGGIIQIEHSEDIHTGIKLVNNGWKIKYIPIILAIGLCPENMHAYFHQQNRWCSGNMSLLFYPEFWKSKLTNSQKLCFISGFLYYVSYAFAVLMSFQVFVLLFWNFKFISLVHALPFLPFLIFGFVVLPLFRISKVKYGTIIARTAHANSCAYSVILNIIKKPLVWQPTGAIKDKFSKSYVTLIKFNAFVFLVYLGMLGLTISSGHFPVLNSEYYTIFIWIFFYIIVNSIFLWNSYLSLDDIKKKEISDSSSGSLFLWRLSTAGSYVFLLCAVFFTGIMIA